MITMKTVWKMALVLPVLGCGREPELREWTPADHAAAAPVEGDRRAGIEPPSPDIEARVAAEIWSGFCAPCHGATGAGDGPSKPAGAVVADLRDPALQAARTDEALAAVISGGKGLMPKFGDQIRPEGIAALVRHVRTLAAPTPTP